jgi:hypothetical protein
LAIAGLLIAVAVAVLASKLTSQRIGLSDQPVQAGEALAPRAHGTGDRRHGPRADSGNGQSPGQTTTQPPTTPTTTPATGDDNPDATTLGGEEEADDDD